MLIYKRPARSYPEQDPMLKGDVMRTWNAIDRLRPQLGNQFCIRLACLVLGLTIIQARPSAAGPTVIDAFGRSVTIASVGRIMTLGPDVTEIAFALGMGERVIAVDRSSRFPPEAMEKTNVGYRRSLSSEGLLSLQPDLILAAEDIGPPEVMDVLKTLSISVVFLPEDNSLSGIQRKITIMAAALDRKEEGEALVRSVGEEFRAAERLVERIPENARKKVAFFHGLTRLIAAGDDTAADTIIAYAGGKNPFNGIKGYKPASEEIILEMAPDTILMLADGKGGPTLDEVFSAPALRETPAAKNRSLIVLDGPYMLGFGPRTAEAIRKLAETLYPGILGKEPAR